MTDWIELKQSFSLCEKRAACLDSLVSCNWHCATAIMMNFLVELESHTARICEQRYSMWLMAADQKCKYIHDLTSTLDSNDPICKAEDLVIAATYNGRADVEPTTEISCSRAGPWILWAWRYAFERVKSRTLILNGLVEESFPSNKYEVKYCSSAWNVACCFRTEIRPSLEKRKLRYRAWSVHFMKPLSSWRWNHRDVRCVWWRLSLQNPVMWS
jgi:hypothetical protein